MNRLAFGGRYITQDAHELGARKVTHFATPHGLHPLHGKVFKEQLIVPVRQFVCQLEEPIAATVDNALVDTDNVGFCFMPILRPLNLARHLALSKAQFSKSLAIVQGRFNRLPLRRGEESLQSNKSSHVG